MRWQPWGSGLDLAGEYTALPDTLAELRDKGKGKGNVDLCGAL